MVDAAAGAISSTLPDDSVAALPPLTPTSSMTLSIVKPETTGPPLMKPAMSSISSRLPMPENATLVTVPLASSNVSPAATTSVALPVSVPERMPPFWKTIVPLLTAPDRMAPPSIMTSPPLLIVVALALSLIPPRHHEGAARQDGRRNINAEQIDDLGAAVRHDDADGQAVVGQGTAAADDRCAGVAYTCEIQQVDFGTGENGGGDHQPVDAEVGVGRSSGQIGGTAVLHVELAAADRRGTGQASEEDLQFGEGVHGRGDRHAAADEQTTEIDNRCLFQ